MSNINSANLANSISYKGKLRTTLTTLGKPHSFTLTNKGLPGLFGLIAAAITGNDVKNSLPRYLDIVYETGDGLQSVLTKPVPFVGINYGPTKSFDGIENGLSAFFNATLTTSDIVSVSLLNENMGLKAVMYSSDRKVILAEIADNGGSSVSNKLYKILISIDKGTNAQFEWELHFSNK